MLYEEKVGMRRKERNGRPTKVSIVCFRVEYVFVSGDVSVWRKVRASVGGGGQDMALGRYVLTF